MGICSDYFLKKMADYNRPPPIRSMPPMLRSSPFLGGRSLPSLPEHKHSSWNTQSLQVMPVYRPTVSTSTGEQIVAPVLNHQSLLPLQPILPSCWSNAGRFPPIHYPPPAPLDYLSIPQQNQIPTYEIIKSTVNFESILNSWLSYYEPIFTERRHCKEQNNIQLPMFRNMLVKWSELIQKMQSTCKQNEMSSSLSLQNELNTVQQYCTNPHIVNLVKKKLRLIHKKRRYLKRIRDRRQNSQLQSSTCSVIVQSTTGSILERIKSDISLTIEQSGVHDEQQINVDNHTNNIIDNESKHKLQMKTILHKSIDECQTRLRLLDNLEKLRSARLTQAEQQGGLFPYQLNEKFNSDVNELKDQLSVQIQKLESLYSKVKDAIRNIVNRQSKSNYNTVSRTEGNYCIHVPNLPKSIKMELFGNYSANNSSSRFYIFISFFDTNGSTDNKQISFKYAWDKYLKMDIPTNENVLDSLTSLQLPKCWILPQMNNNHHQNIDPNNNQNSNIQTNNQETNEIDNIKEKWNKYLRPIPYCYT
ncbi:uncharacterized protein DC041_0010031 [Schistosoma bovis]|uniref:Uncharacterized protein n=1 Tax=Schistosoma bovis TaxID=6184 RepID=A0A430QLX2_SCHBO|nr:uncharacterized protein DC041_0010031 [Schistosoma bovis]